ncbi:MAG: HD domain-containing protein [Nitrospirae bacterium]|nr:HD domain-containing protein [Nitrospirota bacterium]
MIRDAHISLLDIVMCLSSSMDLISKQVVNHHKRVAAISLGVATEMGMSLEYQNNLTIAALLHDCGAFSCYERIQLLEFDNESAEIEKHAEIGYSLLNSFKPFEKVAPIVRFHHRDFGTGPEALERVPIASYILHLADRVDSLVDLERDILGQVKDICDKLDENVGTKFLPEAVNVFKKLALRESFWFDVLYSPIDQIVNRRSGLIKIELNMDELLGLAELFCRFIDFRSKFTSTHSTGVAATAETIGRLVGFSERECNMIKIAGYLHDLGKLAIPLEILEKADKLTQSEFNIVKRHSFYTYILLEPIKDLEIIATWGSFHHERLDGKGYPFHHDKKNLSVGARIIAVADVFTALTEDRPYRKGMSVDEAIAILSTMAGEGAIDAGIVSVLTQNLDEINAFRVLYQTKASKLYSDYLIFDD